MSVQFWLNFYHIFQECEQNYIYTFSNFSDQKKQMTVKFCKNVRRLKNSTVNLSRILISTTKIARINCAKAEFLKNSTASYFFVQNFADKDAVVCKYGCILLFFKNVTRKKIPQNTTHNMCAEFWSYSCNKITKTWI